MKDYNHGHLDARPSYLSVSNFGHVSLDRAGHPQPLRGGRMSDYYHYKECMDDARKLTQEAEDLMAKRGLSRNTETQAKCASLLKKATLLRKLAMEYSFGTPRQGCEEVTRGNTESQTSVNDKRSPVAQG